MLRRPSNELVSHLFCGHKMARQRFVWISVSAFVITRFIRVIHVLEADFRVDYPNKSGNDKEREKRSYKSINNLR